MRLLKALSVLEVNMLSTQLQEQACGSAVKEEANLVVACIDLYFGDQ